MRDKWPRVCYVFSVIRIGSVPYLNAKPLIEGLRGVRLVPPSDLGRLLASGKIDVGLVSVSEALRNGWAWVPGVAVASRGATDSVRLHHAVPLREVRRVALDRNSGTSNLLARIILEKRHGARPACVVRDPRRGLTFKGYDAAVTIGDVSFRKFGIANVDLGVEWRKFTGRPMVYAVWAYRRGHPQAREIARIVRAAKSLGLRRIDEIVRREAGRLGLSPRFCRTYITKRISYDLGPAERAGLRLYAKYARSLTLL